VIKNSKTSKRLGAAKTATKKAVKHAAERVVKAMSDKDTRQIDADQATRDVEKNQHDQMHTTSQEKIAERPGDWTQDKAAGLGYPDCDNTEHSGSIDIEDATEAVKENDVDKMHTTSQESLAAASFPKTGDSHDHKYKRGMLPGGKYIRTCVFPGCTETEEIDRCEWDKTPV
jgi:hypothetical protein